jgi:hypothetical protein
MISIEICGRRFGKSARLRKQFYAIVGVGNLMVELVSGELTQVETCIAGPMRTKMMGVNHEEGAGVIILGAGILQKTQ